MRGGEKSTTIVFTKQLTVKDKESEEEKRDEHDEHVMERLPGAGGDEDPHQREESGEKKQLPQGAAPLGRPARIRTFIRQLGDPLPASKKQNDGQRQKADSGHHGQGRREDLREGEGGGMAQSHRAVTQAGGEENRRQAQDGCDPGHKSSGREGVKRELQLPAADSACQAAKHCAKPQKG